MIDLRSVRELAGELLHSLLVRLQSTAVDTTVDELQRRRDAQCCCGVCDLGDGP